MSNRLGKAVRLGQMLFCAGLLAWGVAAAWYIWQARRAGDVLADAIAVTWPEDAGPRFGTRAKLLSAAQNMRDGRFRAVAADLGPLEEPTGEQKVTAQRFFAKSQALRQRFIAATTAAQTQAEDGADVDVVRDALARAMAAAAKSDRPGVAAQIEFAEAALDETGLGFGSGVSAGGGPEAVTQLIRDVGPTFKLGQDLMTEGHAAADKLVSRASWHFQAKEFKQAASLVGLAAELLGVELPTPVTAITPKWFDGLAQPPSAEVTEGEAMAVVELGEAMSGSAPSKPVITLVKKARRELDAGRPAEAYWWASVALSALGMNEQAIAAAAETPEAESAPDETSETETPE